MARTNDPHAATLKAWETRGRAQDAGGGSAVQARSDWKAGDAEWANGITKAPEDRHSLESKMEATWDEHNGMHERARDAVIDYMQDYDRVNATLRSGRSDDATVAKVDEAFRLHALTAQKDEVVYRGMSDTLDDLKPGDVIEDKGFVCTTRSPDVARRYAVGREGRDPSREVMVRIGLRGGSRYLAGGYRDAELILNRGSRFRVLRAGRDSDGRLAYEMELLP